MSEITYRRYRIIPRKTGLWFATIVAPGTTMVLREIPKATIAEGEQVLISRAKDIVDKRIAAAAAAKKAKDEALAKALDKAKAKAKGRRSSPKT
ncbi:MAG: hypothetical protein ACKVP3_14975 [Hyphomicrobiaceae bacterium]